jgi:polysaccharide export outer membrane protein
MSMHRYVLLAAALLVAPLALADNAAVSSTSSSELPSAYHIQPGDILQVSVWKEQDLQSEVLVRPDGAFSFPLAGDVDTRGKSVEELRNELTTRLKRYIPDPVVTVAVRQIVGNRIFVLGQVNRPGDFQFSRPVDVMQALSMAGGTTSYAALNDIVILRRERGQLQTIRFHYAEVARGKDLAQNILLNSGDTIVVP